MESVLDTDDFVFMRNLCIHRTTIGLYGGIAWKIENCFDRWFCVFAEASYAVERSTTVPLNVVDR